MHARSYSIPNRLTSHTPQKQPPLPGVSPPGGFQPPPPPKPSKSTQTRTNHQKLAYEQLSKIFNTSLITTRSPSKRDLSAELYELTQSAPFKILLTAIKQLAILQNISEKQAAEVLIKTFRKVDTVWEEYIFQEGLDRLRNPPPRSS